MIRTDSGMRSQAPLLSRLPRAGIRVRPDTVRQAAEGWLAHGLMGRSPKTVRKNQNVLEPILLGFRSRN